MRAIIKGGAGANWQAGRGGGPSELRSSSNSVVVVGSDVPESDSASFATSEVGGGKPWKKHNNRNKKEKIKRSHKT